MSIHYKFDTHVDLITEKISSRNGQLANIAGIAGQDTLKMLASATVLSIATYGAAIYARNKANINRVQVKLNKTMRMITALRMKTHVADMIRELDWMKFQLMVAYEKIMLLNRIVSNSAAPFCMILVAAAPHQTRYAVRERELKFADDVTGAKVSPGCVCTLVRSVGML